MTPRPHDLVIAALRAPDHLPAWSMAHWDLLVRQARSAGLLARLAWLFEERGQLPAVPAQVAAHLHSATRLAQAQHLEVRREVAQVQSALRGLGVPIILLKGAAYVLAGLPAARGRVFSDTDILVPKAALPEVEAALMQHGWAGTHHSPYDQRYYRQWMHELPPLLHLRRQTALDVHHAIAPQTARIRPESSKLIAAAVRLPGDATLSVLAPEDMLLHSMLHLFVNDELSHALRDLSDIALLLQHFGSESDFERRIIGRAVELGLEDPLAWALRNVAAVFGATAVPTGYQNVLLNAPAGGRERVADALWAHALRSPHRSTEGAYTHWALRILYVRAHWLRMPAGLLAMHLAVKAVRSRDEAAAAAHRGA